MNVDIIKPIKISIDDLRRVLDYNPTTGEFKWLVKVTRGIVIGSNTGVATIPGRYPTITIYGERYYAHRLAWYHFYGKSPTIGIDHIDNDKSNNAISNLREATAAQNARNMSISTRNKSGYKGVFWYKRGSNWAAQIRINGVRTHLGYFETAKEAHSAYCAAADKHYGGFSNHG